MGGETRTALAGQSGPHFIGWDVLSLSGKEPPTGVADKRETITTSSQPPASTPSLCLVDKSQQKALVSDWIKNPERGPWAPALQHLMHGVGGNVPHLHHPPLYRAYGREISARVLLYPWSISSNKVVAHLVRGQNCISIAWRHGLSRH